jgi:hypothetical protein
MAKKHSNPVVDQELVLQTEFAQQVYDRSFSRTSSALFAIDVVLHLIGSDEEVDEVESVIANLMQAWLADQEGEVARMRVALEANGVQGDLTYTAPMTAKVQVTSPQTARLLEIMRRYDQLVMTADALWLNDLMPSKDRSRLIYDWKRRTQRLGNRIVDIQRRAHDAVNRRRQDEERARELKAKAGAANDAGKGGEQDDAGNDEPAAETPGSVRGVAVGGEAS